MIRLHDDFWNIRGSFKIAKVIDIGTHMSLVRRPNGRFIIVDSYSLAGDELAEVMALTDEGKAVDAILNVHPFHTIHCQTLKDALPHAKMIGTRRHRQEVPDLDWDSASIEDVATQSGFMDALEFSTPRGVDFVSADDSVHVASVLVRHRASGIVHVDDTINVLMPPAILKSLFPEPRLRFHPMLKKALEERSGAADDYAEWARDLAQEWAGTPAVCAAHSAIRELDEGQWEAEILEALDNVDDILADHRAKFG
ncbi:MAG: hypothetical protein GW858_10080 [Sphingomonadales bacterium]|nr:hypothetical protein [Sphingomonadales bacterium]NCQ21393.1 hypothetical protein [Sphingomonadales bacterium]NCT04180.1 hypothetical protein [Sphingomonadales bacterium]